MILKLAWRNIWRNRRRTLITMASVFFAVLLSCMMMSLKEGVYAKMVESMIGNYTGYAQVQDTAFADEHSLDQSFSDSDSLHVKLDQEKKIRFWLPKIESGALAATNEKTRVTLVTGVDLEKEKRFRNLDQRVTAGRFPGADEKAVLIGQGLADFFSLKVQDTIVLLGQGYHGASATGKYPVAGILKLGSPELSNQLVVMPLKEAQWFYGMDGMVTGIVLGFHRSADAESVVHSIRNQLAPGLTALHWKEIMPELQNLIETDRMEGYVFMFILYLIVSFGIFGTLLMMLAERRREFSMLIAIGMMRNILAFSVWLEMVLLSVSGAIMGMLAAFPVAWYFHRHPISLGSDMKKMTEEYGIEAVLQASVEPVVFLQQLLVILLIAALISLYPFFRILRWNALKEMRK